MEARGWAADANALAEFLAEPNLCRVATIDPDGSPHVVPAWYHWETGKFFIGAGADDHKVANVRRDGRAAVEVDSDIRRKRGILARGSARIVNGEAGRQSYLEVSQAQVRRYQPDRPPIETAARMASRGEPVVIVVSVEHIISWGR